MPDARASLLIVDDALSIRMVLSETLARNGYTARSAEWLAHRNRAMTFRFLNCSETMSWECRNDTGRHDQRRPARSSRWTSGSPRLSWPRQPTALPPHVLSREIVKEYFGCVFGVSGRRLEAILAVVDNSRIDRRYTIFPVDYLIEPRPLAQI